eukprot:EG_transcript_28786
MTAATLEYRRQEDPSIAKEADAHKNRGWLPWKPPHTVERARRCRPSAGGCLVFLPPPPPCPTSEAHQWSTGPLSVRTFLALDSAALVLNLCTYNLTKVFKIHFRSALLAGV